MSQIGIKPRISILEKVLIHSNLCCINIYSWKKVFINTIILPNFSFIIVKIAKSIFHILLYLTLSRLNCIKTHSLLSFLFQVNLLTYYAVFFLFIFSKIILNSNSNNHDSREKYCHQTISYLLTQ